MNNRIYRQPKVRIRAAASRARSLFWDVDLDSLPAWKASCLRLLRIFHGVAMDITDRQLTLRAMSLVYTTLLAMVPLLAISFSVLKGLGIHNRMEPVLLNLLAPLGEKAPQFAETIVGFVDKMQLGVLGFLGIAMLFYTVISLIQKIEAAFNYVWRITRLRSLTQRFRDYLSVIIVGPVLVFSSFGIMAGLMSTPLIERLMAVRMLGWLFALASWSLPTVMIILAFTFIYVFVPNTGVRLRSALMGGGIAGVLWNGIGWAFATFVATLPSYVEVYAGFATPLIFLIWLYMGWLILLVGASIAFYHQNSDQVPTARTHLNFSARSQDVLALAVVSLIGRAYYGGGSALSLDDISERLEVPSQPIDEILGWLEAAGQVAATAEDPPKFLPACPWESTNVNDLLIVVRQGGENLDLDHGVRRYEPPLELGVSEIMRRLDLSLEKALGGLKLRDLARNNSGDEPNQMRLGSVEPVSGKKVG